MRRAWSEFCSCLVARRHEPSPHAHARTRAQASAAALGEAAQRDEQPNEAQLQMQPEASTSGRAADSPRAFIPAARSEQSSPVAATSLRSKPAKNTVTLGAEDQERQQQQQQQQQEQLQQHQDEPEKRATSHTLSKKESRLAAAAVRFATALERNDSNGPGPPARAATGDERSTAGAGAGATTPVEWRPSRVRLLLPRQDSASSSSRGGAGGGSGGKGLAAGAAGPAVQAAPAMPRRSYAALSISSKSDVETRALIQLSSLLLAQQVDYRSELEEIMMTHGSAFPQDLLEQMLGRHSVALPQRHLRVLETRYRYEDDDGEQEEQEQAGEGRAADEGAGNSNSNRGGDSDGIGKIDGVALLKDLDRAAFRHIALGAANEGAGPGHSRAGEAVGAPSGPNSVANSKKGLMPPGNLGDKARILQMVSSRLAEDETLRIRAGSGGEGLTPEHLQEVAEQIDLTSVAVPVGTKAPYVPSTADPDSFQVPVWSLRAMHLRKQQRDRALSGADPGLRHLGQAGREALRKHITRRSIFQQQEIIANAVVAAARAAVAPSARLAEGTIQLSGSTRAASLQRNGSKGSSPLRRSATSIPANAPADAETATAACTIGDGEGSAAAAVTGGVHRCGDDGGGGGAGGQSDVETTSQDHFNDAPCGAMCPGFVIDSGDTQGCFGGASGPSITLVRPWAASCTRGDVAREVSGEGTGSSSPVGMPPRKGTSLTGDGPVGSGDGSGALPRALSPVSKSAVASPRAGHPGGGGSSSGEGIDGRSGTTSPRAMRPGGTSRSGTGDGVGSGDGSCCAGGSSASRLRGQHTAPGASIWSAQSRKALGVGPGGMMVLPVLIVAATPRPPDLPQPADKTAV